MRHCVPPVAMRGMAPTVALIRMGFPKQLGRAEALWREAAAQELEAAQFALGCALRDGGLFGGGEAEGERWLRRAAEQGHEGAVEMLARGD